LSGCIKNNRVGWVGVVIGGDIFGVGEGSRPPLGAIEHWPVSLRTALGICLHSTTPVAVYWGSELITLYNDVCAQFVGNHHPRALGTPARVLYADIWATVGPLFLTAFEQGVPTASRNQRVPLRHEGQCEDVRHDLSINPIHDENGTVAGIMVIAFDITDHVLTARALADEMAELQRLQSQQRVLVAELQHRTRNLLSVVRAIACHSFMGQVAGGTLDGFSERLSSLGRVQGLISSAEGERVKLSEIVRAELEAYAHATRSRLEVHGPTVRLANHQVQVIALALHELVTNAVKYGALQAPQGRLSITWETWLGAQGRQRLALLWRESGVQMPPSAAIRRGQGRELIENALRFSLHADTQLVFGDDGVWCRIELPIDRRVADRLDPAQIEAGA
jgi:two-component sensor histidine kinase